jgi:hypothetical protein
MRALIVLVALTGLAQAKPKPLAASCTCTAIDEAAQRTKLDPKKKTPRPKTVHKVECAVASTDARLSDAKATGRATWAKGHAEAEGKLVGDVQVKKDIRRLLLIELETDAWPKCDDIELAVAVDTGDGAHFQQTMKTSGSCPSR